MHEGMKEIGRIVPTHRLPTQLEVDEMVRRAREDHAQAIKEALLEAGAAIARLARKAASVLRRERGGRFSRA